LYSWLCPESAL